MIAILLGLAVFVFLVAHGYICIRKRDRILIENGYFVGKSIDDVVIFIGKFRGKASTWNGGFNYYWSIGHASFFLTTNPEGVVVDYCPPRQNNQSIQSFFSEHGDLLIGQRITDIKRSIGQSDNYGSFDFGVDVDVWNVSTNRKISIWSNGGVCTHICQEDE